MSLEEARILVIGASAGGVEPLIELLRQVPRAFPAAIVIVLHQAPDRRSRLSSILQPVSALPVRDTEDKETLRPGTVYIAPPDYHLLVEDESQFSLSAAEPVNFSRPSIDVTLESCADVFGPRMTGIVLSGASSDGAQGLRAVQRAGGVAIVQDPAEAKVATMPQAALKACPTAMTLRIREFSQVLDAVGRKASAPARGAGHLR